MLQFSWIVNENLESGALWVWRLERRELESRLTATVMVLKPETPINLINRLFIMVNGIGYMSSGLNSGVSGLILQVKRHLDCHESYIQPRRFVNGGFHSKKGVNCHITWCRWRWAWKLPPLLATVPPSPLFNNTGSRCSTELDFHWATW